MPHVCFVGCSAVILFIFAGCSRYQDVKQKLPFVFANNVQCSVVKVIDGDKFDCHLASVQIKGVKMIGFQIPASFKERAGKFTRSELYRGLPVRLEPDELTTEGVNLLAYVYLPGGKMLNSLLIELGYAKYGGKPPNVRYEKYFPRLESEAEEKRMGLWGENKEINN